MTARILVVDDSRQMRDFFAGSVLRPAGYEVLLASEGLAGLRMAKMHQPDLIVADLQMPGLTGLELKRALTEAGMTTPLILVTAEGSEDIASKATLAGVAAYLPKPVNIDVMLAAVEQALTVERLRRERAEAMSALEVRVHQMEELRTIGGVLTARLDLVEVLSLILTAALNLTDADCGSLFLLDESDAQLRLRAVRGPNDTAVRTVQEPAADLMADYVIRTGKPIVYRPAVTGSLQGAPNYPVLYMPVRSRERVLGVLAVDRRKRQQPFADAGVSPMTILADYAAIAINNARLFAEVELASITDVLTGLFNRRQVMHLAERELQRTRRFSRPLSAIMLDIDHFKLVNDTYGHAAGDQVIAEVGQRLRKGIRTIDIAGRYGGEEFVLLLPETALLGAGMLADRLRKSIAGAPFATSGGQLPITVSVGVASLEPDVPDVAKLVERADSALYSAKLAGRNKVAAFGLPA